MQKVNIKSFCKINLSLRVLKKLPNGFHDINSLITFCDLYDVISINKIKGLKDKIIFSGKFNKGIDVKSNTVTKVLYLLRKKNYIKKQAFKINIKKNIPHGSGLGGGSSNAATLLNYFNLKMPLKLRKNELYSIAKQIGSDVPICLEKRNTFLIAEGKKILRLNKKFNLNILIVFPNIISSTKRIYSSTKTFGYYRSKLKHNFNTKNQLINFLKNEKNDLERSVINFYPKIKGIINFIKIQKGCLFSRITGSGSACIGIFSNMKAANYTQKLIKFNFPKYWCVVSKTI